MRRSAPWILAAVVGCSSSSAGDDASQAEGTASDSGPTDSADTTGATTEETEGSGEGGSTAAAGSSGAATTGNSMLCGDGPPQLVIGHGADGYAPLDSGPAELFYGPQGGVHIFLGLRSPGLDVSRLGELRMRAFLDGRLVADQPEGAILVCPPGLGAAQATSLILIFNVGPEVLHEATVEVEAELTDAAGTMLEATAPVTIFDPMHGETGDSTGGDSTGGDSGGSTGGPPSTTGDTTGNTTGGGTSTTG